MSWRGHLAAGLASALLVSPTLTAQQGAPAPDGTDWLVFVDDLHLDFRNTGRLRDLLKVLVAELIQDGDRFAIGSGGPSNLTSDWTTDREVLRRTTRQVTGNGLKPSDIIAGHPYVIDEMRYRVEVSLAAAFKLVNAANSGPERRRPIDLIFISNGYDLTDGAVNAAVSEFAVAARDADVRIFTIDPRVVHESAGRELGVDLESWRKYVSATQEPLRFLADVTGGLAIVDPQGAADVVKKITAAAR